MTGKICAFTGHRPKSFPWRYNEADAHCKWLKDRISDEIDRAIAEGYRIFIAGGAQGADMWCAEIVLQKKRQHPDLGISLILAIPFLTYAVYFSRSEKQRLECIINEADKRIVTSKTDSTKGVTSKYYRRNQFMVNHSQRLIAVFDQSAGINGGTKYTIDYAQSQGLEVVRIPWLAGYKRYISDGEEVGF